MRLRTCTKIHQEVLFSERGDGVTSIKRRRRDLSGDCVWILVTMSQCSQLKVNLEPSTWRQRQRHQATSGPHDTQYCMEDPEQAFIECASSRTDEAGGMEIEPQQSDEPEPTLEDEFHDLHLNLLVLNVLAHAPIYNDILDKYVESLELGKNRSSFVQGEIPAKMEDLRLFTLPCRLRDSKPFDTLAYLGSCVNIIPLYLFKKLNIRLLEETDHIFGLAD
ncbi:hypothetical protein Tco_0931216 [Tanacetum coccineum]